MTNELPTAGAAGPDVVRLVHQVWAEAAARAGVDLNGFDPGAPLSDRLAWARTRGLAVGTVLSRFSSKLQHSTTAQVRDCARFAAAGGVYVPPEYVCVDEAVSGRKTRRGGLDRVRGILAAKLAGVLVVYKVSRLFRVGYKGFEFFQEEVVEEGLRAVSVSQGIDTADEKAWKPLAYLHGVMDEMLLSTIADHVYSGLKGLFERGYVVGALPVGYRREEVPGAAPTNRGLPRTVPRVDEGVAERVRRHVAWHLDGLPLREGWRRWVHDGGPCDPRSTTGQMTYPAYRRLLSNPRYTGRWAFGRKRNVWSHKRDYTRQVDRPGTEVVVAQCEELRVLSDEQFFGLQARLDALKTGPRGPKKRRDVRLWDLVTDCFVCGRCGVRFYLGGANGRAMSCKRGALCPCRVMVNREEAVRAVCAALAGRLAGDADLVEGVVARAAGRAGEGDGPARAALERAEATVAARTRKIEDLMDLAGEGTDEDRAARKAKLRAAEAERAEARAERARLLRSLEEPRPALTAEAVRGHLADLARLLDEGASGALGDDATYRAGEAFRLMVGGRVVVDTEPRPGRKRPNVRGTFAPDLLGPARAALGLGDGPAPDPGAVSAWLRRRPKKDLLAERAHELIDGDGLSFREAAEVFRREGHTGNSGVVWQYYHRYYEMVGRPVPDQPYNNGRPRRAPSPK